MPIVTLTEDNKTRYYAVTDGNEISATALVDEHKLADSSSREHAEHDLRTEYLRRLTEHACDCAHLAHLASHPPDAEDEHDVWSLNLTERLTKKVVSDAIWLRTYEPFTALTAEAVDHEGGTTRLLIDGEKVYSTGDDSWEATRLALWERDPWRRDHFASIEREKAEREAANKYPPATEKRLNKALDTWLAALDSARKDREKAAERKTIANKTVRRPKSKRTTKRTRRAA